MGIKHLPRVTLIACDTHSPGRALASLRHSLTQIKPARTILFTNVILSLKDEIEIVQIPVLHGKVDYSRWIMRELWKYIETDFVLITQWDGFVTCADAWVDEFYEYDYVGSPWIYEHGRNIGNGGFCLKSKRLCHILGTDPFIEILHPEDQSLGILYRGYLEQKYQIKFPDEELADKFAFELKEPIQKTFGKHGVFHPEYKEVVVVRRLSSLGDVVQTEPILHHFHKKGFRVVLDTLPQFYNLFLFHYFKVHHPDEIDPRLMQKARVISLDMAYESQPDQLHLLSYFEMAGIQDGEIRNPKLTLQFNPKTPEYKLFRKYCVLHIDERAQPGRNIYGVEWEDVVWHLREKGYDVIQIGQGKHPKIFNAVEMRNMNEPMLMRLIGGADLFIGVDSGPFNIALAMDTPAIVFFGSVHPDYIIPDKANVTVISNHNADKPICRLPHCWSSAISTEGVECVETHGVINRVTKMWQGTECVEQEAIPPCVRFTTQQVIDAINQKI